MSIKLRISEVINGNRPKSPTVTVEEEKENINSYKAINGILQVS
jgi:hypothetical protein